MNVINKKGLLSLIITGTLFSAATLADPVTINVTGKVIAAACTVDNSGTYNVDLGQSIQASTLNGATPYSGWKTFNVTFSNCPTGTNYVTAVFSGTPSTVKSDLYANATGAGYAPNVAVEIQRVTGGVNAGKGKSITVDVDAARKATFDLQARAYGTGSVTPGDIQSVITMDMSYN